LMPCRKSDVSRNDFSSKTGERETYDGEDGPDSRSQHGNVVLSPLELADDPRSGGDEEGLSRNAVNDPLADEVGEGSTGQVSGGASENGGVERAEGVVRVDGGREERDVVGRGGRGVDGSGEESGTGNGGNGALGGERGRGTGVGGVGRGGGDRVSVVRRRRRVKAARLDSVSGKLRAGEGASGGGSRADHVARNEREAGGKGGKGEREQSWPKKVEVLDY
jgi:hypothetical protein